MRIDWHLHHTLQKLLRDHDALMTERERSGARNGVAPAVIPCDQEWASLLVIASSPTRSKCDAFQADHKQLRQRQQERRQKRRQKKWQSSLPQSTSSAVSNHRTVNIG